MKRRISPYQYHFLKNEFKYLEQNGKLQEGQTEDLLSLYESEVYGVKGKRINPIRVLLVIGAILIGLSILSFVASNWSEMTRLSKYLLLLFLLIGFYGTGYKLENRNSQLSRVFYYIGAFAYGAEIFYIGQMFHLGGNVETAFLMWGIGILPLGFYLKDEALKLISISFIYVFLHIKFMFDEGNLAYVMIVILPFLFLFGHFVMRRSILLFVANIAIAYEFVQLHMIIRPIELDRLPFELLVVIPALFYIGHTLMKKSLPLFIANVVFTLQTIGVFLSYIDNINIVVFVMIYFVIGMTLFYIQHKDYVLPLKIAGGVLHFVTAMMLTIPDVWGEFKIISDENALILSVVFSVLYGIYALFLVNRGSLFGVGIVSVLILRFYVDLSLAFMNKSIAFLIGGLLLIGLGYWFEKTRKGEASEHAKE